MRHIPYSEWPVETYAQHVRETREDREPPAPPAPPTVEARYNAAAAALTAATAEFRAAAEALARQLAPDDAELAEGLIAAAEVMRVWGVQEPTAPYVHDARAEERRHYYAGIGVDPDRPRVESRCLSAADLPAELPTGQDVTYVIVNGLDADYQPRPRRQRHTR